MAIQLPEGTRDFLPNEALYWEHFKKTAFTLFGRYGYLPIETPMFELTELFVRGIGEATDVVGKEMFKVFSGANLEKLLAGQKLKAKSVLSLRPEGTASVVRAAIQHDLVPQGAPPVKLVYGGPMFRAERPQKGRYRQFYQIGVECLGADDPTTDAETIIMLMRFFVELGIPLPSMRLLLNSMGCDACRPAYRTTLLEFLKEHEGDLCEDCNRRREMNPLRAFDCKNPSCAEVMVEAPKMADRLCESCAEHYDTMKSYVKASGLDFEEDARLVRGLDYYTRTVFEVQVVDGLGSQNAIGGGGRYDKLFAEVGGRSTSGLGFALGYERCVLALQATGWDFPPVPAPAVYVACVDSSVRAQAFELVQEARDKGITIDMDHQGRSLKSQFKVADKLGVRCVVVLGPDELAQKKVKIRNMQTREETLVALDELVDALR